LFRSKYRSTQALLQTDEPDAHEVQVSVVRLQTCPAAQQLLPQQLLPTGQHLLPQQISLSPQQNVSPGPATLQITWPVGQRQNPPTQVLPPRQAFPQAPQLFRSDCKETQVPPHGVRSPGQAAH
jgi:hypothetical protein